MCVVSMIGDHFTKKFEPMVFPQAPTWSWAFSDVSREEFDSLKRDVEDMKELLKAAKKYDEEHGEPDCEIDEKINLLREVAKAVGVDLDDVLKKETH